MTLLEKVRLLAHERGTSLTTLESVLGFGSGTIAGWDRSSPTLDKIIKVADYFGVSIDDLASDVSLDQTQSIVDRIQSLCADRGITIASLERNLKLSNASIRKWDKATPSGDRLAKVADYFGVSVDYLLGREKENTPHINGVYLSIAKEAQDRGIDPDDVRTIIEMVEKLSKRNNDNK